MTDREQCILVWSFTAGVFVTLLVLRVREKRRLRQEVLRKYDAWAAAVVAQCRKQERPTVVTFNGGPLDGASLIPGSIEPHKTRFSFVLSHDPEHHICYRREPGASTAKFVAVLSAEEAKAWASREGSTT